MNLEELKECLNEYFVDPSRPPEDTLAGLQELTEEIEIMVDALEGG